MLNAVNGYEASMQALSDEQLRAKTTEFKERLKKGDTLDSLLPEAYAAVREAAIRTIGQRHYDVQILGGIVLHQGRIARDEDRRGKNASGDPAVVFKRA